MHNNIAKQKAEAKAEVEAIINEIMISKNPEMNKILAISVIKSESKNIQSSFSVIQGQLKKLKQSSKNS